MFFAANNPNVVAAKLSEPCIACFESNSRGLMFSIYGNAEFRSLESKDCAFPQLQKESGW
jgi:hypothetical protein